jgi:hypothetical protein
MKLFEKYSYGQKNVALLLIGVLLLAVSYKRSFSKTLELISYSNELDQKIEDGKASQKNIQHLQKNLYDINHFIGKENNSVEQVQQQFLGFFDVNGKQLSLKQIDEVYSFDNPDYTVNTLKIDLEGPYVPLTNFIKLVEEKFEYARIVHVSNYLLTDPLSQKKSLVTTLLIQHYDQKN